MLQKIKSIFLVFEITPTHIFNQSNTIKCLSSHFLITIRIDFQRLHVSPSTYKQNKVILTIKH